MCGLRDILVDGAADLAQGGIAVIEDGDLVIGVLRVKGRLHADESRCRHQGGPAYRGELLGKPGVVLEDRRRVVGERFSTEEVQLACPWHGRSYDEETGGCTSDALFPLQRFDGVARAGHTYLRLPEQAS